jgi:hypothetical protein
MAEIDYSKIPDKDLEILATGNYEGVSELTLQYMAGQSGSSFDAFTSNAGRGLTSSLRGLGILQPDEEADIQSEQESRMRLETNPYAGWAGLLIGSALDPVTLPAAILKPLAIGGKVLTGALRGSAGGAFGGLVDPVYEGMGDSRAMNVTGGAVLGGALGGLVGKLFGRSAKVEGDVGGKATEAEVDAAKILEADDPAKAIDEVAAKAEEPAIPESAVFNKESGVFETMSEETPIVNFAMPQQLAGAKPRFNKFTTGFDNDIDKALYIVGNSTSKSSNHDAYVDWLKGVTGLDDASVLAAARSSRGELVRSFGRAAPDANGSILAEPSTFSQTIRQQRSAPKQIATPVKPTVTVKDGLDDKDLALLEKAGVKIIVGRDGSLIVQDKFAPANASMMSNQTFLSRMEAAGIGIDIPAFRKRTKDDALAGQAAEREQMMTPEFWSRQEPPSADRAPVFDKQEWTGVQQMTPETRAAWTRPPRPTNQSSMEGLQTGAPREGDAAGASRAKPSSIYGSDLAPGLSKMSPTELAARSTMIEPEEVLKMMPPSERAALEAKYPSGLAEYISQGQVRLKEILRKNNNIVEWMLAKSRATRGMSESEVGAFTPFYHQAMAAREQVLDKAVAHRAAGGSFESGEGAQLAQDLLYYTGIALFKKNEGSKAGRALNAFRLLSERARKGEPIKNIFPGVAC